MSASAASIVLVLFACVFAGCTTENSQPGTDSGDAKSNASRDPIPDFSGKRLRGRSHLNLINGALYADHIVTSAADPNTRSAKGRVFFEEAHQNGKPTHLVNYAYAERATCNLSTGTLTLLGNPSAEWNLGPFGPSVVVSKSPSVQMEVGPDSHLRITGPTTTFSRPRTK